MATAADDPFQALISKSVITTDDGRLFLPFKNTTSYQGYQQSAAPDGSLSVVNRDENGMPVYAYPGAEQPNMTTYSSAEDFYNQLDPYGVGVIGEGRQNAIALTSATRGKYGGDYGYFFNPNDLVGTNPATTGGSRPNENGLWQAASLIAPAVGGLFFGVGAGGSVGSSAFEGSVPTAASGAAGAPAATAPAATPSATPATSSLPSLKDVGNILSAVSSVYSIASLKSASRSASTPTGTAGGSAPPTVTPPATMPSFGVQTRAVQRASIEQQTLRRGRASTVLTSEPSERLGA